MTWLFVAKKKWIPWEFWSKDRCTIPVRTQVIGVTSQTWRASGRIPWVEGILLHFRWIQQHSVGLVCDRHRVHGPALRVRAERLLKCSSAPARSGAAPTPVRAGRVLGVGTPPAAASPTAGISGVGPWFCTWTGSARARAAARPSATWGTEHDGTGRLQLYDHVQDESYVIGYVQNTTATLRKATPFLMLLQPGKGRLLYLAPRRTSEVW
jgi:hypothetical protein